MDEWKERNFLSRTRNIEREVPPLNHNIACCEVAFLKNVYNTSFFTRNDDFFICVASSSMSFFSFPSLCCNAGIIAVIASKSSKRKERTLQREESHSIEEEELDS